MPGSSTEQLTKPPEAQASSQQLEGRKEGAVEGGLPGRGSAEEMSPGSSEEGACPTRSWFIIPPSAARELLKSHDLLLLPSWAAKGEMSCMASSFWASVPHWESVLFHFKIQKKLNKTEVPWCRWESSIAHFCLPRKNINQTWSLPGLGYIFSGWLFSLSFEYLEQNTLVLLMTSKILGPLCSKW